MSELYFNTNADAGDGSLRDIIANAHDGDVIKPDPNAAWDDVIVISLLNTLTINKALTIDGVDRRLRIDGQGAVRLVTVSAAKTITFNQCEFVRGKNTTTCGGICATVNGASLTLNRCLFAGNENKTIGDIASTSSTNKWARVDAVDCVFVGGNTMPISTARITDYLFTRCTLAGYVTKTSLSLSKLKDTITALYSTAPSTVGFITAPPDDVDAETWTNDLWETWDLRLSTDSSYTTGSESVETDVDFLGHERKPNGARGAFEGAWIVTKEDEVVEIEPTTADYLDMEPNSVLKIHGQDAVVRIEREAGAFQGEIVGDAGAWCYLVVPQGDDIDVLTDRASVIEYSAHIQTASASDAAVNWTAENVDVPVDVQLKNNGTWETIEQVAGGSYEITLPPETFVRLYDGASFFVVKTPEGPIDRSFWTIKSWAKPGAGAQDPNEKVWNATAWAITPIVN